ncbi:MAG: type II toxin-antitoxin system RelB/DinJ family antitoxin [Candidatus Kapaibacteriota bacterium]|jgi:DNA-damage-inducible protein J
MLHIEIESGLQQEAEQILQEFGISADNAVTMLYEYVRTEHRLPMELRVPNQLTRTTIERANAGLDVTRCSSADDLYQKLGI